MNLLIITCILITAETEILLATNSFPSRPRANTLSNSSTLSENQIALAYPLPPLLLYNYTYNTDTGIHAQEEGLLGEIDRESLQVLGSYNYTDNEGNTFQVSYIANEDGFQPKGAHLPTVPPLIKKALQYIAEHSEENEKE